MTYVSMSPKVICEENCERAKRPGGEGRGCPFPSACRGYCAFSDLHFLQIARGQVDNIELYISMPFSDTFIIIIAERAPVEITYISMSPKVICEENCEQAKRSKGGGGSGRVLC